MTKSFLPIQVPSQASAAAAGEALNSVQTALEQLPAGSAPGISLIGALKGAWSRARSAAVELNRTQGGRVAGEALADCADKLLTLLLEFAARRARSESTQPFPGVALLAMGSYGRRELAPYSDIDLLLLYAEGAPEAALEALAANFLRPLWDAGLQMGHSVRSSQECLSAMRDAAEDGSALETTTSILEARFIAGEAALAEAFYKVELPQFFKGWGRAFVDAKFEETIKRWGGGTLYRTQPHLKDSPGALRDFQLALWIDQASRMSGHLPRLNDRPLVSREAIDEAQAGYERLLTFRVALHALRPQAGRAGFSHATGGGGRTGL